MDRFMILLGHYVFYCNNHEGQGSRFYARLCRISKLCEFNERALYMEGEEYEEAVRIYNQLAQKHKRPKWEREADAR